MVTTNRKTILLNDLSGYIYQTLLQTLLRTYMYEKTIVCS